MRLILREEDRPNDARAPLTPADAAQLVEADWRVLVERSSARVFSDGEYGEAGCQLTEPGSWAEAGSDSLVLGVGPLPDAPDALRANYVHISRLLDEPDGWRDQMARFQRGKGRLFDIDALTDAKGRKLAGCGALAGWLGAAIGLGRLLGRRLKRPGPEQGLIPFDARNDVVELLEPMAERGERVSAAIVGADGRAGRAAAALLTRMGVSVSLWGRGETEDLPTNRNRRDALLGHDMLVNCAAPSGPGLILASLEHLAARACHLQVIVDIACAPTSPRSPLPVYLEPTTWESPIRALGMNGRGGLIEIAALDDLPALLPRESSLELSDQLVELLLDFPGGGPWRRAAAAFDSALARSADSG